MYKNTETRYGSVSKFFHWTASITIIALLICGFFMGDLPKTGGLRGTAYNLHKVTGVLILGLMILRILWTWVNPRPRLPASLPWIEQAAARIGHGLLYVAVFMMTLSGWSMATAAGYFPKLFAYPLALPGVPKSKPIAQFFNHIHEWTAWVLLALISVHVLAGLIHHFVHKNDVLRKMLPGK